MNKQKATRKHIWEEDYIGRWLSSICFEKAEEKEYVMDEWEDKTKWRTL